MKKIFVIIILSLSQIIHAQQSVDAIRKQATTTAQQGDFTGAVQQLEQALKQYPDNIDLLKDEAYISFLGRDFQRSLQLGKKITEGDSADVQSYQILGMTYKAIADYKEADKMYKSALKKFPNSGILYSEYGDLLTQYDNKRGAIEQWEKGIQVAPNYSSNYYYASKYYSEQNNVLWTVIYAEIFVNIESLSQRTTEIKNLLLNTYKQILSGKTNISNLKNGGSDFEKAIAKSFYTAFDSTGTNDVVFPDMITAFRTRFILNWNNNFAVSYPYHLFDLQTQLLREGLFDAYNQWLFGIIINKNKYDNWVYTHDADAQEYAQFQRNVLFKMPPEQYYTHSFN